MNRPILSKRKSFKKTLRRLEIKLQRNSGVQYLSRALYAGYMKIVYATSKWTYLGIEEIQITLGDQPRILCLWHETLAASSYIVPKLRIKCKVLASDHADGQLPLHQIRALGIEPILISTSKSKNKALKEAIRTLKSGASLAITTDGPLGPRRRSKTGAVVISGLTNVPIVPMGLHCHRKVTLPTWDEFILPLPFNCITLSVGSPLQISKTDLKNPQSACTELDNHLNNEMKRCTSEAQSV